MNDVEKKEKVLKEAPTIQKISGGEFEKFAQQVLKQLIDDNVPPTPSNFEIYFDKLLEGKPVTFKKRVLEMIEFDKENDSQKRANVERELKQTFTYVKGLVSSIASIYKNINILKILTQKKMDELNLNSLNITAQNILKEFKGDVGKLTLLMDKQLEKIKQDYEAVSNSYKKINEESEFDDKYGVYNRKFLINSLKSDSEDIKKYGYSISVLFLKVKDDVLNGFVLQKDRVMFLRNIAKLLTKTSRRSDVIAHYGDGIFAMVMKHTTLENAKKACDRIIDLIYGTTFFINDQELDIDTELVLFALEADCVVEDKIAKALDELKNTSKDSVYYIALGEEESK